jgi:hypothetical protein
MHLSIPDRKARREGKKVRSIPNTRLARLWHYILRAIFLAVSIGGIGALSYYMFALTPQQPTDPIIFIRILQIRTLDPDATKEERAALLRQIKYTYKQAHVPHIPVDLLDIIREAVNTP